VIFLETSVFDSLGASMSAWLQQRDNCRDPSAKLKKLTRIVASSSSLFTAPESSKLTFCFSVSDLPAKEELADLEGLNFLLLGIDSGSSGYA